MPTNRSYFHNHQNEIIYVCMYVCMYVCIDNLSVYLSIYLDYREFAVCLPFETEGASLCYVISINLSIYIFIYLSIYLDYRKFAVCLPFETEGALSLGYVIFLMLINGVAFSTLMGCYLKMYCAIRGSQVDICLITAGPRFLYLSKPGFHIYLYLYLSI